jgi:polyferredoxin
MAREKLRQRLRKNILLVMFLLFPVVYYYLSPYLIIMGASEGIISGSFIMFGLMFLVSFFLGRAFCGWVCPAGGEQDLCGRLRNKRVNGRAIDWIKYVIWIPWISIIVFTFYKSGGIKSADFFYQTFHGISISNLPSLLFFIFVAGVIALIALAIGRRGFCHTICWMAPFMIIGRKLRNIINLPALSLSSDKEKCIDCKICNLKCPMSLEVNNMAKSGNMESSECILCGNCIDVCPKSVIKYTFSALGGNSRNTLFHRHK